MQIMPDCDCRKWNMGHFCGFQCGQNRIFITFIQTCMDHVGCISKGKAHNKQPNYFFKKFFAFCEIPESMNCASYKIFFKGFTKSEPKLFHCHSVEMKLLTKLIQSIYLLPLYEQYWIVNLIASSVICLCPLICRLQTSMIDTEFSKTIIDCAGRTLAF